MEEKQTNKKREYDQSYIISFIFTIPIYSIVTLLFKKMLECIMLIAENSSYT